MVSDPERVVPIYGNGRERRLATGLSSVFSLAFSASIGLALVWFPLPTPIKSCLPSGVMATAVGYQPVGMNPLTWLRWGVATSITAMQLLSALATNSVLPSGAMARASGVLPSGAIGKRAVWMVSVTIPRRVSMTETQLLDAQATKIRSSVGEAAIWLGCSPTAIRV